MAQIVRMTDHLSQVRPVEKTRLPDCLNELVGRMRRREIVMIFSDFFTDLDALEVVLQRMRYARHEVVLFHVLHHDELEFPFDGMTRFLGLEDAAALLVQPEELRAGYLRSLEAYSARFEEICQRNRVERVPVDTSHDMGGVFIDYLNHRSLLNRGR
jgi:uncharacterized protein (DUF58 family)